MTWNFHSYYCDSADGLISKIKLVDTQVVMLKALRERVRTRTKEVFDEVKEIVKTSNAMQSLESMTQRVANSRLRHLRPEAQVEVAKIIKGMDESTRKELLTLTPRFWTQGSFQYDTLNHPYSTPPQEMDIDDGTYLPMTIFEDRPVIGHRLLLLLVDSSLKSLVHENPGWSFEAKRTCARIKIPSLHTHIDVPMYAIPADKFMEKEAALAKAKHTYAMDSIGGMQGITFNRAGYELDEGCVNLALREGEGMWMKSDPKTVEDWFVASCKRIGPHLRDVCRFMKSWRDVQWTDGGGPTSISLMAAAVSILNRIAHDRDDIGAVMRTLAKYLPDEFNSGVDSPDPTDVKPLFPPKVEHGDREIKIVAKLYELREILVDAQNCSTKELALDSMNRAFGRRVIKSDLIVSSSAAPAFVSQPSSGTQAENISTTMASG